MALPAVLIELAACERRGDVSVPCGVAAVIKPKRSAQLGCNSAASLPIGSNMTFCSLTRDLSQP